MNKDKYMVILIGVDSGNVEEVYEAVKLGSPDPGTPGAIILKCKQATPHEGPIRDVISEATHVTKFAASSPGCRYIWFKGRYLKICN